MRLERCLAGLLTTAALLSCAGDALLPRAAAREATVSSVRPPAVCFAPGTDPAYVEEVHASAAANGSLPNSFLAPGGLDFQFNPAFRWSQTATNAGPLVLGAPTTLTWSIVPRIDVGCAALKRPASGIISARSLSLLTQEPACLASRD